MRKHRILAPDCWGAYRRNDIRDPRFLYLPILRQMLNSFSYLVCLFINSKLLFWAPGLCCKSSYVSWLYPYPFGAVPQNYLRGYLPGLKSLENRQVKYNAQLLGYSFLFFFQLTLWKKWSSKEHIWLDMVMETIVQRFDVPYEEGPLLSLRWHTQMNRMVSVLSRDYSL